jgi:hypothetical protein
MAPLIRPRCWAQYEEVTRHPRVESTALHENDVSSSANSIHVPEPAHIEKISTPRHCVGSSSSFRADVGLGALAYPAREALLKHHEGR